MEIDPGTGEPPKYDKPGAAPRLKRRIFVIAIIAIAAAVAGGEGYRLILSSRGGPVRAQDSDARNTAPQLVKEGDQITVPEGSPLRGKLAIAPVAEKEIQRTLVLPAVVEADPSHTVKVLPAVAGRVVELRTELGARVVQGDVLAVIDSSDLAMAISDAEKARAADKLTKQTLDRMLALEKTAAIAIKDRQQAQNDYAQAQAELQRSEAAGDRSPGWNQRANPTADDEIPNHGQRYRPANGPRSFSERSNRLGSDRRRPRYHLGHGERPEKDTTLVVKGQSVEVVFTAYPGETFRGTVLFVSDVLDPDTRRTRVRIAFKNPDLRLKPNMFANATFLAPKRNLPVIPTTALLLRNETDQVFVEVRPWVFEARAVEVGFQEGDRTIVTGGLKAGDRVVVKDGVLLND